MEPFCLLEASLVYGFIAIDGHERAIGVVKGTLSAAHNPRSSIVLDDLGG